MSAATDKQGSDKAAAKKAEGAQTVVDTIAGWPDATRGTAQRLHEIITQTGPDLVPRLWYGMPAYAKDGKVLCFFRGEDKSKERYMTLGFNDVANLDEGNLWPVAYALTEITSAEEEQIAALIRRAVG